MNKSESKYFNTAVRMDEAFLSLLEQKDCAYITVKEICEKAGVNRSTFYLHYETIGDLLAESVQYMQKQFFSHFSGETFYLRRKAPHPVSKYLVPQVKHKQILSVVSFLMKTA